ncbi:methylglutaconyl-CoA hydratase, mitochondrial-like [Bradysia coprophila]|uniref:methylglutaconyl-CoA hydratase, mitochondrial-like n=1 Tax=Bradysia coprophila TaxID=38358 RepID=UPI00187DB50B|nr:methylglutaconyl-CoA hydratase, mitochondrial-like [Bradysia coprophila]XP_037025339.1 methylglutaconyl-CoA hydratase, mitochondrial-like [Bradysia coprophila]
MVVFMRNARQLFSSLPQIRLFSSYHPNSNSSEVTLSYLTDDKHQGIAIIGMNKPDTRNAFNTSMISNLTGAVDVLARDKSVRVVIVRSLLPDVFCAGADLKERANFTVIQMQRWHASLRGLLKNIEQLPMPVIGAVDGAALGGGLELALACDIRTASSTAKIGLVETKHAILPGAGGTQRLPRIVGPAIAKELIFTARILNGTEATKLGICNHVVEQNSENDSAYKKAIDIATEILPNGPVGVRMAKRAIDQGLQADINTGYLVEEACYAQTIPTADRLEGLKAFAEKRQPRYKGE